MSIDGMHIPDSWKWTSAEVACGSVRDGTHDTPQYLETGIPLVTSKNLVNGDICFNKTKLISLEEHTEISKRSGVENGDILYAMIGTIGNPVVVNTAKLFSIKNVALFKKNVDYIRPKYLKYWLESSDFDKWLKPRLRGTTQKFAPLGLLRSLPIPLAPLNQQKRIVAEIEKQFSCLDEAVANLKRVKANLKRYKAAVLKAAVEGKLTEEWRKQHPDVEPADKLLERILSERRKKWQGRGKYKEPVVPDTTDLPKLPEGWVWVRLDAIAAIKGGITVDKKRKDPTARFVPYLRVANVQRGYLDLREMKEIEAPLSSIEDLKLEVGDVLFNEGGDRDKLGRGWVWEGQVEECIHQNHVFRARPYLDEVNSKLISWWGNSFGQYYFLRVGKQTTNLASINKTKLSEFPVPLPPFEEQACIDIEVERLLSVVVKAEVQVDTNLRRADRLRQSILKKAFSGNLIFNAVTANPQVTPQVRKSKAEK